MVATPLLSLFPLCLTYLIWFCIIVPIISQANNSPWALLCSLYFIMPLLHPVPMFMVLLFWFIHYICLHPRALLVTQSAMSSAGHTIDFTLYISVFSSFLYFTSLKVLKNLLVKESSDHTQREARKTGLSHFSGTFNYTTFTHIPPPPSMDCWWCWEMSSHISAMLRQMVLKRNCLWCCCFPDQTFASLK